MKLRRRWEQYKAYLGGYFWLPCPICGEMFGGQEEHGRLCLKNESGWRTCINCAKEARKRSEESYNEEDARTIF